MTTLGSIVIRRGQERDALCVGILATQVFLDTYAGGGIRPDLAREVLTGYSQEAFARRLADPPTTFLLAERFVRDEPHLVALAFYRAHGYRAAGTSDYVFEDRAYETQILAKDLLGTE